MDKRLSPSPLLFALLNLGTFNIYSIYWAYRNWQYIKVREGSDIRPFWRAVFLPFMYNELIKDLDADTGEKLYKSDNIRYFLAVIYFVAAISSNLSEQTFVGSFFIFVPLLPTVYKMWKRDSWTPPKHALKWSVPSVLLGPLALLAILQLTLWDIPEAVIDGSELSESNREILIENSLLQPDEEILKFYAGGLTSVLEDGQFLTDCCVVSYWEDLETSRIMNNRVGYEDITDLDVTWAESLMDDTVIKVYVNETDYFELWLSKQNDGDREFIEAFKEQIVKMRMALSSRDEVTI
ncbi:hypothetical protein ACWJJH_04500 [Endozoicomonadaceae bacterium StTr2]